VVKSFTVKSPKTINAMEKLERKNNGGNQQMTQRYRSQQFPSLRGGIDWWSCPSRSPLLNPSSICKDHGRDGEEARFLGSTIEYERERE
jgi:hypothetical protein